MFSAPPTSYLEEVLHTFRIIAIAFSADSLHLFDLACFAGSLNIFEVDFRILAEVHDGTQEIEQTCKVKNSITTSTKTSYLFVLNFCFLKLNSKYKFANLHLPH